MLDTSHDRRSASVFGDGCMRRPFCNVSKERDVHIVYPLCSVVSRSNPYAGHANGAQFSVTVDLLPIM